MPIKVKYTLVKGTTVMVYRDWQECRDEEGEAQLLEFDRHFGNFKNEKGTTFVGERWKVRFLGSNFVTHRYIRVKNYLVKDFYEPSRYLQRKNRDRDD